MLTGGEKFQKEKLVGDLSFETKPVSVACVQLLRQAHTASRRSTYCSLVELKLLPVPPPASPAKLFGSLETNRSGLYGGWGSVVSLILARKRQRCEVTLRVVVMQEPIVEQTFLI
ncbi:hypothetical protein TNCV_4696681 [Trichonephila clavipes]|nr:hypothetical protein TNCV_4696681 [Trichonephila clavipes]